MADEVTKGEDLESKSTEQNLAVPEPIKYPSDYVERMREQESDYAKFLPHSELGPIFTIRTSKGEVIRIDSFYIDGQAKGEKMRRYYLIAQNTNGEIVGDSSTDVVTSQVNTDNLKAEGFTAAGVRGMGVGTQLELANAVVLQRYAAESLKEIAWHASNYNLEVLEELKSKRTELPDPDLESQITEKELEQANWMRIYGPGGRLGMNEDAERVFTTETTIDTTNPDFKVELPVTDPDLYKRQKTDAIERVLDRAKKVAQNQ